MRHVRKKLVGGLSLKNTLYYSLVFLSARKADLKKGFQHLVLVLVLVVVVVVVVGGGTRVKKGF
jgi:hypothetical protein